MSVPSNADLVWQTLHSSRNPLTPWEIVAWVQETAPTVTAKQVRSALKSLRHQGHVIRVRKELRRCPKRGWVTVPLYATESQQTQLNATPPDSENVSTFVKDVLDYLRTYPLYAVGRTVRGVYEDVLPHMEERSGLSAARIYLASLMKTGHVLRVKRVRPDRNGRLRSQWVYYPTIPQPASKPTSYRGLLLKEYS